jgi:flavin reductase ActVB
MPIPPATFREALAHFASGVTVVTARYDAGGVEALAGFTATSFASVSLEPPIVLVCVNHIASARDGFLRAQTFGVNVLHEGQSRVAEQFSRRGIDRFAGIELLQSAGAPLVEGAVVQLECRHHARHEVGDHTVVFGEVLSCRVSPARPLLYYARRFAALGPDPAPPEAERAMEVERDA